MLFGITNLAVHQLTMVDDELTLTAADSELSPSPNSELLVESLHKTVNAKAKGFARFKEDSGFLAGLNSSVNSVESTIFDFTKVSSDRLRQELSKYPFAEEGFVVFAKYCHLATDYLLVAYLTSDQSISVKSDLELVSTAHLNVNGADIVARINLTDLATKGSEERQISFLKGRVGRKVSDFFLDFLEAEVTLNAPQQAKVFVQAIGDFAASGDLNKDECLAIKKTAHDYCKGQISSGEELDISELSSELASVNEVSFLDFTRDQGYELSESIPATTSDVKRLTKFVGAGGGLNITFDSMLLGERVFYDPETDTLTIKGTPPNLRHSLTQTKM